MSTSGGTAPNKHIRFRTVSLCAMAIGVFFGLSLAFWILFVRHHELLATFMIDHYTIDVYAEPEWSYEPPGYIYFELKQWGQTRIPERRFMGIGPDRKPREAFTLIKTKHEEIVALVLIDDVQMIHEFSSGFTWPGPYTNVTESQWEMAELLLQKLFADNPGFRCSRQDWYRKQLDRHKLNEG